MPEPEPEHALVMADFALDILDCMKRVKQDKLVKGWDITDIGLRVGLHSGPVTAGILRGGKCMYQLFGETVYEANRMESSGSPGRVQASDETALLLKHGGWSHSIIERDDPPYRNDVCTQTYWLSRGDHMYPVLTAGEVKRDGWVGATR